MQLLVPAYKSSQAPESYTAVEMLNAFSTIDHGAACQEVEKRLAAMSGTTDNSEQAQQLASHYHSTLKVLRDREAQLRALAKQSAYDDQVERFIQSSPFIAAQRGAFLFPPLSPTGGYTYFAHFRSLLLLRGSHRRVKHRLRCAYLFSLALPTACSTNSFVAVRRCRSFHLSQVQRNRHPFFLV